MVIGMGYTISVIIIIPVMIIVFRNAEMALPHRTPLLYRFDCETYKKSTAGNLLSAVLFLCKENDKRAIYNKNIVFIQHVWELLTSNRKI